MKTTLVQLLMMIAAAGVARAANPTTAPAASSAPADT